MQFWFFIIKDKMNIVFISNILIRCVFVTNRHAVNRNLGPFYIYILNKDRHWFRMRQSIHKISLFDISGRTF